MRSGVRKSEKNVRPERQGTPKHFKEGVIECHTLKGGQEIYESENVHVFLEERNFLSVL